MPSICFVHKDLSTIDRGGVCTLLKTVASGMKNIGWDVYAITTQDLSMSGITSIKIPVTKDYEVHYKNITRILNDLRPDIAECSNWRYELLDFAQNNIVKTKIVLRCDPPAGSLFDGVDDLEKKERELYNLADARIAVSKFAMSELLRKYGEKKIFLVYNGIQEIPIPSLEKISTLSQVEIIDMANKKFETKNGVDLERFIDDKRKNVFWVGKPTNMKGFDYLEKIVEKGHREYNFIINTGFSGIDKEWSDENYKKATFIRGMKKEEQLALWRRADISISTSRGEGFGIVVSEALSIGLPVVLNSECKVFSEFVPNPAVTLSNASTPDTFLNAMGEVSPKVDYSRNPNEFTQETLVSKSIDVYNSLI